MNEEKNQLKEKMWQVLGSIITNAGKLAVIDVNELFDEVLEEIKADFEEWLSKEPRLVAEEWNDPGTNRYADKKMLTDEHAVWVAEGKLLIAKWLGEP
jgi:hypothetical protein